MVARDMDFPPVWLAGFAVAAALLGRSVPIVVPHALMIGAALVFFGLFVMLGAILQMFLARTSVIPGRDPARLVVTGFFGWSRNPIYLADAILLAGLCIGWNAWLALPLVLLFMALISKRFIQPEEARLAVLFGAEFEEYKKRTRRWI